ncbi:MAG TPA: Fic family protein [Fibrobacteria bacterium]|nr:Fic family protein [Fibrobacteria bacterium]
MNELGFLGELSPERFETPVLLRKLASASRALAELKGVAGTLPNQEILIRTLGLQEAKDSSEIENFVTTHDELFKDDSHDEPGIAPSVKEVQRYRQAMQVGFDSVLAKGVLSLNQILDVQAVLEDHRSGLRKVPGTVLKSGDGRVVYTPPQHPDRIVELMGDLERFLNEPDRFPADPLIKMALAHHQFESIHPFYDGNGRTGRIVNVLYLILSGLLDTPVLYLSRSIMRTKGDYYRLLQAVRERDAWEDWVVYMLEAVETSARDAVGTVKEIRDAFFEAKHRIRAHYKFYSHDLLNNLFSHPYTKIEFVQKDLSVSRLTATKYLDRLAQDGVLEKRRIGRGNYYVNTRLAAILTKDQTP